MFSRITTFFYGVVCYLMFLATFLYAIGFLGNFGVPKSIEAVPQLREAMATVTDRYLTVQQDILETFVESTSRSRTSRAR